MCWTHLCSEITLYIFISTAIMLFLLWGHIFLQGTACGPIWTLSSQWHYPVGEHSLWPRLNSTDCRARPAALLSGGVQPIASPSKEHSLWPHLGDYILQLVAPLDSGAHLGALPNWGAHSMATLDREPSQQAHRTITEPSQGHTHISAWTVASHSKLNSKSHLSWMLPESSSSTPSWAA